MKLAFNIRPRILIIATVSVGALMIFSAFWELDRSKRELSHVVHEEALSLVDVIHQSSVNTILATDQIESLLTERLLNNAWFVADLDSAGLADAGTARRRSPRPTTSSVSTSWTGMGTGSCPITCPNPVTSSCLNGIEPADIIGPILRGETTTMVIGLKDARYEEGQRYAVAVRRRGTEQVEPSS